MKATFNISALGGAGAIDMGSKGKSDVEELKSKNDELRKTCFNNLAAVFAKEGKWQLSLEKAQKVLEQDDKNVKALFRMGSAYRHLREFEKAEEFLTKANDIKSSAAIRNEIARLKTDLANERKKADKKMKKAFKKSGFGAALKTETTKKPETVAGGGEKAGETDKPSETVENTTGGADA